MSDVTLRRPARTFGPLVAYLTWLRLRGVAVWGVILGLYAAAITAAFTSLGDPQQMEQLLQAYPEGISEAFGIEGMATIEGFLQTQIFGLFPLALSFFPILALSAALAGAEERGTMDVLLGNPLPRWQLVAGNFLATAVSLFLILAVMGAIMYGTALLVDVDLDLTASVEAVVNLWPICLFFGGLALLCSALLHRRTLAVALPGLALLAMYLADTLGHVSEDLEVYREFSVFYYYGAAITDGVDWAGFASISGAAVLFVLLATLVFQRRDIYT